MELKKYDDICSNIFEYMDFHTKMTADEIANQNENKRAGNRQADNTKKETLLMNEQTSDLLFGIWANVMSKHRLGHDINFGKDPQNP